MLFEEPKIVEISKHGDDKKGFLSVIEGNESIFPFEIKRVYWTYGAEEGAVKGEQTNIKTHQLLISVLGEVKVELESVSGDCTSYTLNSPEKALYIPPKYWRRVYPSKDAIILNLSSEKYTKEDYVINYESFKSL